MEICKRNTGLEEDKFIDLLNSLSSINAFIKSRETAPVALYMYLMKMHTGFPSEDIGNVFNVTKVTVQRLISQIRSVLKIDFVPHYVNYIRNREDLIQHNTEMSNALFDGNNEQKVMLVADGSYIYVHKSQNYMHQKKTFSGQKKRNFIKVMNVTACDGTIIYSIAPFPGTSNDASILKDLFESTIMFDNLLPGDIMLLDRGFRDVVKTIENKGIVVKTPSNVQSSERKGQLTTIDANRSRLVTALRFVVETRNGHLKTIWKKFDTIWNAYDQMHLAEDLEICSALINKYFPVFGSNRGITAEVTERMLSKLDEVNEVGKVVTKQSFQKNYIKKFIQFEHFNELPKMQENRLFWISLGAYQVKQAVSYTQMHLKQNNNEFKVWVCPDDICQQLFSSFFEDGREPKLFMMKLNSRFRSNVTHRTFVLIDCFNFGEEDCVESVVLGHYCECYNGWRTLGCCSHIMTVAMFLLVTKGHDLKDPSGFLNNLFDHE